MGARQIHQEEKKIFLIAPGFEEGVTIYCVDRIREVGLSAVLVGISSGYVKGAHGISVRVDCSIDEVNPETVAMIAISGGRQHILSLLADPRVKQLFEGTPDNNGIQIVWLNNTIPPDQFSWFKMRDAGQLVQRGYMSVNEFTDHLITLIME